MDDFATLRQRLVDNQIRTSDVTDHALIGAFLDVPRELFVAEQDRPFAYSDRELRMRGAAPDRRMIDPVQLARLIEALDVGPEDRVLVVGCGSGYGAALLARLCGSVVALDADQALTASAAQTLRLLGAANVEVVCGPLEQGWPAEAPFEAILIEGAVEIIPDALVGQLREDGRLAAIERGERISRAILFERAGASATSWPQFAAWATVLPGFCRTREFDFNKV